MRLHIRHLRSEEELRHASVLGSSDEDASVALARTTRQIEEWRVVLYQRRKGLSCADLSFVLRSNSSQARLSLANDHSNRQERDGDSQDRSEQPTAWLTLFSMRASRELTASNSYEQPQFPVARCPAHCAKTGET